MATDLSRGTNAANVNDSSVEKNDGEQARIPASFS
jgi:hypothetical protein